MADCEPKLVHLPGTVLTPEVVLHRTLQKLDGIKAVAVIIQWNDDTFDVDWSNMRVSELCMSSFVLANTVTGVAVPNRATFGEDNGR